MLTFQPVPAETLFPEDDHSNPIGAYRAKVPGGWLVFVGYLVAGTVSWHYSIAFYPDPKHEWDGSSLE